MRTVVSAKPKKAARTSTRAYVLLRLAKGDPQNVARSLREEYGVLMADSLEGPPDVIVVVEAPGRQELADRTVQVLSSVEDMIENVHLRPINC